MGWCSLFYVGISSFSSTIYWKGSPFSLICLCTFVEYQLTVYLLFPTGLHEWLALKQLLHCPCGDLQIAECFFPLGRDCSTVRNRGTVVDTSGNQAESCLLMMGRPRQQSSAICWLHSKPSCVFPCVHMKLVKDSWDEKVFCSTECEWAVQLHITSNMDDSGTDVKSIKSQKDTCIKILFIWKQNRRDQIIYGL